MRGTLIGVLITLALIGYARSADLALKPECRKYEALSLAFVPSKIQKRCKLFERVHEPIKDWQMFVTQDMGLPRAVGEHFTGTLSDALKAATECTAKHHRECHVKPARK